MHRLTIASYNAHDKEMEGKEMPFALYLLNLGVSKLSSYHCSNFIFCTPCTGFVFVLGYITRMLLLSAWNLEYIATIEIALRAGNGIHRPTIVYESYSSHDKEKEQCLSLCNVLNLGVSKLPSLLL